MSSSKEKKSSYVHIDFPRFQQFANQVWYSLPEKDRPFLMRVPDILQKAHARAAGFLPEENSVDLWYLNSWLGSRAFSAKEDYLKNAYLEMMRELEECILD